MSICATRSPKSAETGAARWPKSDNLVVRGSEPDESQKPARAPSRGAFPGSLVNRAPVATAQPESAAGRRGTLGKRRASPEPARRIHRTQDHVGSRCRRAERSRVDRKRRLPPVSAAQDAAVTARAMTRPAWRGRSTKHPISGSSIKMLAWPRRPGNAAESVRAAQAKRWASPAARATVDAPCDLYLYPSGKVFARETKQPENSPGFSTMMCNGNRVVARRMNLRADHPLLVTAILPHEVTHVVLADLFTDPADSALGRRGNRRPGRAARRARDPRGRAARAARDRPGLRPAQADGHGLPRRQGLEPLLRPERILDSLPGRTRAARTVRAVRPEFAARWDRRRPARHVSESAVSPSFKNDGSSMRAADGSRQSRRPVATRVLNQREPRSNDSARMRPSPARRSPSKTR